MLSSHESRNLGWCTYDNSNGACCTTEIWLCLWYYAEVWQHENFLHTYLSSHRVVWAQEYVCIFLELFSHRLQSYGFEKNYYALHTHSSSPDNHVACFVEISGTPFAKTHVSKLSQTSMQDTTPDARAKLRVGCCKAIIHIHTFLSFSTNAAEESFLKKKSSQILPIISASQFSFRTW